MSLPLLLLVIVIKCALLALVLFTAFAYLTLMERVVVARFQGRLGPNRVGPFGLMQPAADAVKTFTKEHIVPAEALASIYVAAPALSMVVAIAAYAVIPVGPPVTLFGQSITLGIANLNIGVLYVFAISSLGVYGIVLGGWASNNKWALLGGLRSAAQMVSYELTLGLAITGVLMLTGSLSLPDIVAAQAPLWFVVKQPVAFLLYMTAAVAEVNRAPFDFPEAEQELASGYHIEYGGLRFTMYFVAEYVNMVTVSSLAVILFLGGYQPFFIPLPGVLWFVLKVVAFLVFFVWIRATWPRLRYDKLMSFGWKVMLPLAAANTMITALLVALRVI